MPKIGLALSGGGSRCISQLGFMKYLEEQGIEIFAVSGASGGAIVAGLYATGKSAEEILELLKNVDFKSHLEYNLTKGTFYSFQKAIPYFQEQFGHIDIKDLKIPFFCAVTDYENGEIVYKTEGDLVTFILASSALVPIFSPIKHKNKIYVDGGICDNLPTLPLSHICDKIIAINVNPISKNIKYSFKGHLQRSMFMMLNANVENSKKISDLFIEIREMGKYSIFDLNNFDLFFDIGYNKAKRFNDKIGFESLYV